MYNTVYPRDRGTKGAKDNAKSDVIANAVGSSVGLASRTHRVGDSTRGCCVPPLSLEREKMGEKRGKEAGLEGEERDGVLNLGITMMRSDEIERVVCVAGQGKKKGEKRAVVEGDRKEGEGYDFNRASKA